MSRMVTMDVFNAFSNFESYISSYNKDTEVNFVNQALVLLLITDVLYWYTF